MFYHHWLSKIKTAGSTSSTKLADSTDYTAALLTN